MLPFRLVLQLVLPLVAELRGSGGMNSCEFLLHGFVHTCTKTVHSTSTVVVFYTETVYSSVVNQDQEQL